METPSPVNARPFAELAVNITRNVASIELDFSPASLQQVDDLICGFREGHTADSIHETICLFGQEGCNVLEKIDESEYGKFAWVIDPEGNKVELWEPLPGQ